MNNNSPFSEFFGNLGTNSRRFFSKHDPYLNFAFVLSILPIPFAAVIAILIAGVGVFFQLNNKFRMDESRYLITIFSLSVLNIIFVYWLYSVATKTYFEFISDFYLSIFDFLKNLFTATNPYI